jgi:hypothetical protein
MNRSTRWHPGRLLLGWAVGVLTTIGLVTLMAGWYEYRQLSTAPGSGSPGSRVTNTDSACQVDRDSAINVGGFEVVPRQDDPCYLRRPRIRPWQWADGIREQLGKLAGAARVPSAATIASTGMVLAAHLGRATNRRVAADSSSCASGPRASA